MYHACFFAGKLPTKCDYRKRVTSQPCILVRCELSSALLAARQGPTLRVYYGNRLEDRKYDMVERPGNKSRSPSEQ